MTKKKGSGAAAKQVQRKPEPPARSSKNRKIIGAVTAAGILIAIIALTTRGGTTGSPGSSTAGADPAEARYIGRLLPTGYQEPKLQDAVVYTQSTPASVLTAKDASSTITVAVSDVVAKRNVVFDYKRQDGKTVPMIAYLKPSGRLFVGVSFCPPCEGERQTIASDLTLTCDSCGTKRNLETGVGISGACKLYPLDEVPATVAGGNLVIEKSVIEGWTPQPKDRQIG